MHSNCDILYRRSPEPNRTEQVAAVEPWATYLHTSVSLATCVTSTNASPLGVAVCLPAGKNMLALGQREGAREGERERGREKERERERETARERQRERERIELN